jgi:hypothetical protein
VSCCAALPHAATPHLAGGGEHEQDLPVRHRTNPDPEELGERLVLEADPAVQGR